MTQSFRMVERKSANVPTHNTTKAQSREHGHVGSRALLVEHSGTKVERLCDEQGARRTNDTNANGDCLTRETSGHQERQTLKREGTRSTDSDTRTRTTERSEGVS